MNDKKQKFWTGGPTGDYQMEIGDIIKTKEQKVFRIAFGIHESMTTFPTNPVSFSITYTINFEQA